jgi:hypothetical protein
MKFIIPLPVILSILLIGFELLLIVRLLVKKFRNPGEWVLFIGGSLAAFVLLFLVGPWAFISVYLRWAFAVAYLLALIISFPNIKRRPSKRPRTSKRFIFKRVAYILLFGFGLYLYGKSLSYEGEPARLSFPLKNGKYYVMQGGSGFISNPFHIGYSIISFQEAKSIRYAMDIAKLNSWGNHAASVYSEKVDDYEIYSDTVYAPCAGTVIKVLDGVRDNMPGVMHLEESYGNYIVIQSKGYRVKLAHLKKGSIKVQEGMRVLPGRPIAQQGNSGMSIEPHLHLEARAGYDETDHDSGHTIPMVFEGDFYTINDVIRNE